MRSLARRCRLFACLIFATIGFFGTVSGTTVRPAFAQDGVVAGFRESLAPYGQWSQHPRWGEVWIPTEVRRDWRPYRYGHWGYTDEWGWYWISNEEDWGWVTYHYGRWLFDRDMGWIWIPGTEWGPAWVSWRRGRDHVGWAPLPPDDVFDEVSEDPEAWVFVRVRDFVSPRLDDVEIVRGDETRIFIRETTVENRTLVLGRERIAVNPGIPPSFVASAVGRPLHSIEVLFGVQL